MRRFAPILILLCLLAMVSYLPHGDTTQTINDTIYSECGSVDYQIFAGLNLQLLSK